MSSNLGPLTLGRWWARSKSRPAEQPQAPAEEDLGVLLHQLPDGSWPDVPEEAIGKRITWVFRRGKAMQSTARRGQ